MSNEPFSSSFFSHNHSSYLPSVVVLGGGTGTFMMLQSLKNLPVRLTALLTMVDDGGSNKVLRDQFGLLPTSGIRQAIVALSENQTLLRELFMYRFHKGEGIAGMTFGNLFMAAISDVVGTQQRGILETMKLLQVKGEIYPISYDNVQLVAQYQDGSQVVGEHAIDEPQHDGRMQITHLFTNPAAQISAEAQRALAHADFILFGPGDFYTNTIANFVIGGAPQAVAASRAKKIFVANLMTKYGETYGFTLSSYLHQLDLYLGSENIDGVVFNNNSHFPTKALDQYREQQAHPVIDDFQEEQYPNIHLYRADLLGSTFFHKQEADTLERSILRHDPAKFARFFEASFLTRPAHLVIR